MINVRCKNCGHTTEVRLMHVAQIFRCAKCKECITVPSKERFEAIYKSPKIQTSNSNLTESSPDVSLQMDKATLLKEKVDVEERERPPMRGVENLDKKKKKQKSLISHVRWWAGFQIVVCGIMFFVSLMVLIKTDDSELSLSLFAFFLVLGVLAVNAWRLRKWAILGETILFTMTSIWNALVLVTNSGRDGMLTTAVYLGFSVSIAMEFYRAFKADLRRD